MVSKIFTYQLYSLHLDFGFEVVSVAASHHRTVPSCFRQHFALMASQSPALWQRFWLNILHPLYDLLSFEGYLIDFKILISNEISNNY